MQIICIVGSIALICSFVTLWLWTITSATRKVNQLGVALVDERLNIFSGLKGWRKRRELVSSAEQYHKQAKVALDARKWSVARSIAESGLHALKQAAEAQARC